MLYIYILPLFVCSVSGEETSDEAFWRRSDHKVVTYRDTCIQGGEIKVHCISRPLIGVMECSGQNEMLHLYSAPLFEWYQVLYIFRLSLLEEKRTQSSHQEIIAVMERLTDTRTDG